jgi:subtilisin-like proprotein convertase family protein
MAGRRRTQGISAIVFAALLATGVLATSAIAGGDVYEPKPVDLKIPDGKGKVTTSIGIDDANAVGDVFVGVRVKHPRTKDLKLTLTSPGGTKVTLTNRDTKGANLGTGQGCSGNPTIFRDNGQELSTGTAPYTSSTFKPAQPLGAMDSEPIDGKWKLTAKDLKSGEHGKLKCYLVSVYYEAM